ncbi:MAG: hypothetical protein A2521_16635 [Deltaproteobacteria bacterium RIFOXYD12_FULL_57_12]|nr:MAG: hypothetical protein A2521_16635 [Deltaproteobacteria bacterium RIFOXYD12_FULL_57_12]
MRAWFQKMLARHREVQQQKAGLQLQDLKTRYHIFRALLDQNNRAVEIISDLGPLLRASTISAGLVEEIEELLAVSGQLVEKLQRLSYGAYNALLVRQGLLAAAIQKAIADLPTQPRLPFCLPLDEVGPDFVSAVGGKAAALAKLRRRPAYAVPDGFVIPVHACRLFLDRAGLSRQLVEQLQPFLRNPAQHTADGLFDAMHAAILAAPIPESLATAILAASQPFFATGRPGMAVRSSAASEDSRLHSFAGQFVTVLNVPDQKGLLMAFRQVVASFFNRRSLTYRLNSGLDPLAFDMAVLCLEMVPARAAGILLTRDPNGADQDTLLVSAVLGLGEAAVSGNAMADLYLVSRSDLTPVRQEIVEKEKRLVCAPGGGIAEEMVPEADRQQPALTAAQLKTLAAWALTIEQDEGLPQDIEWALTADQRLVLLQNRPLKVGGRSVPPLLDQPDKEILLGPGIITAEGRATGRVVLGRRRQDLEDMGKGPVILVLPQSLVDAVSVLATVSGLLVELGNPADHLSCVAREYGIPMLTGMRGALNILKNGQWVTLDGRAGVVRSASDEEKNAAEQTWEMSAVRPPPVLTPAGHPVLAKIRDLLIPLNLTDAYGPTFSIHECRSLHDIVRFVHEKAVLAMFNATDTLLESTSGMVLNLESDVPFVLSLIDLGGGVLEPERRRRRISPAEVLCIPFTALWQGIADPRLLWGPKGGVRQNGGALSSWITDHRSERPVGMPNYVIVSRDYLNLNARMDFHFTMIDTVCGFDRKANYLKFRFKGGGTTPVQRRRRALCISEILEEHNFFVDLHDDLINATLSGTTRENIEAGLTCLGLLLGFTRLLDATMVDDGMPHLAAQAFLAGDFQLAGLPNPDHKASSTVQA